MGKIIKLKESELVDMVYIINEQIYGSDTNARQAKQTPDYNFSIGSELFKNGIDSIDTANKSFLIVANKIKRTPKDMIIYLTGGASAVGSSNGYDNISLAKRRSQNFKQALSKMGIDVSNVRLKKPIVGVSTVKNSPEAEKEQFVKVEITKPGENISAIDNTSVLNPHVKPLPTKIVPFKTLRIPDSMFDKVIDILLQNGIKLK